MTLQARVTLRRGIDKAFPTHKAAARSVNYSEEMLSKVLAGERNLAPDMAPRLSREHIMIGQAVAEEATGYGCFAYINGDRHPQTMIRRVEKEDYEADQAMRLLPWLLIDKEGPEDLVGEERARAVHAGRELCDRINTDFNFVAEIDDRYKLGLVNYLTERNRPLAAAR
jgi:hypothetical protein